MLFHSNLNSNIRSTHELIVFCHEQERVLFPLPKTYEEARRVAMDAFGLRGDVILETLDLQGSIGIRTRIHSTAWEGIAPVLSSIVVRFPNDVVVLPRRSEVVSSSARRLSSQRRTNAVPNVAPIRLSTAAANISAGPSSARRTSLVRSPVIRTNVSTGSSSSSASKEAQPQPSSSKAEQLEPKSKAKKTPEPVPAPTKAREATPQEEEEEEEEIRIVSPTKKRVYKPRILSDYGLEGDQLEEEKNKPAESEEEEYDELEDTEFASVAPPVSKTPASSQGRGASRAPSASRSGEGGGAVELDAMPSTSRELERQQSPKIKTEKIKVEKGQPKPAPVPAVSANSQTQDTTSSQLQPKPDENFLVMIEYNDDPDSRMLFKTRGRHMVSKVLMQACRTFGVEEFYHNARLVLLVEDEDEGEVYRSVCNRQDTMAQAGAEPNARFVVEIVEEEDE